MIIKVLGPGCAKCKTLENNVKTALEETGKSAEVIKVSKMNDIMEYDIMMTPALVIDEEIKISGRVATVREIKEMLQEE